MLRIGWEVAVFIYKPWGGRLYFHQRGLKKDSRFAHEKHVIILSRCIENMSILTIFGHFYVKPANESVQDYVYAISMLYTILSTRLNQNCFSIRDSLFKK